MRLVALALLLATTAEAQRAYPLALPRGCRDRSCVRGRGFSSNSSGPPSCGQPGGGVCDAGFNGFQGFTLGTFGWGAECSGISPMPGYGTFAGGGQPRYTRSGAVGFTCYDGGTCMYLDHSTSCCKSNGDCVEMWGDDPTNGGNYAQVPVSQQYNNPNAYGVWVTYPMVQRLASSRDLSASPWVATAGVSANVYPGPFGYFLNGPGGTAMAQLTAQTDGGQSVCQTVVSGTSTVCSVSGWLKAGSGTSAIISMKGTGNSAGDRTCVIDGLSDAGQGQRYGCVGTAPYSGATALQACVTVDAGSIGASDFQMECDSNVVGVVTTYAPNLATTGTFSRGPSSFNIPRPDAGLVSAAQGCLGVGVSRRRYDGESYLSIVASDSQASRIYLAANGNTALLGLDIAQSLDSDSNALSMPFKLYDAGYAYVVSAWDAGSGLKYMFAGGVQQAGTFSGSVWLDTSDLYMGSTGGSYSNASEVQVGPIAWGPTVNSCSNVPTYNKTAHMIYAIGDGWSGSLYNGGADGGFTYPSWVNTVNSRVAVEPQGCNIDNRVYENGGITDNLPGRFDKFAYGVEDSMVVWVGYTDLLNGVDGPTLFSNTKYYLTRRARSGVMMYWLGVPPSNGKATAQTSAYYDSWLPYCLDAGFANSTPMHPEPNLTCIDAHALLAPDGGDFVVPPYDGGFLSEVGAAAVGNLILNNYP